MVFKTAKVIRVVEEAHERNGVIVQLVSDNHEGNTMYEVNVYVGGVSQLELFKDYDCMWMAAVYADEVFEDLTREFA